MTMLVTLERAKWHLRETDSARDAEIEAMIEEASAAIIDYLEHRANPDWTPETVPPEIRKAVLLELAAADMGRDGEKDGPQPLSDAVKNLLRRWRDPVLA